MNKQKIEKAIETLKAIYPSQKEIRTGEYDHVADALDDAIFALQQQLNGGWIPISERWPDKSGYYLTTYHEWTDGNYLPKYDNTKVKILRYQDAIFKLPVCCDTQAEQDTHREVLAWRELPEIWRNEDE